MASLKNLKRTVVFTAPQAAYLETEAAKLGLTFAELVRRIIDLHRGK